MYKEYKNLENVKKELYEIKNSLKAERNDRVVTIPESSRTVKPVDLLKSIAADLSKSQNQGLQVRINSSEYER